MQKKRSIGVTVMGILFILQGLILLSSPYGLIFSHQLKKPYIIRGANLRLNEIEETFGRLASKEPNFNLEMSSSRRIKKLR